MGTSTHSKGQKGSTPLVPSWLEEQEDNKNVPIPPNGQSNRFTIPRTELTRFINSSGRSTGTAKRGISNYIKNTLHGSINATKRLGAARQSTSRLFDIAAVFSSGGASEVERYLSFGKLTKKPAIKVFEIITEFICPDGGTQDEGIARDAYISAIEESSELETVLFEDLTFEQIILLVKRTVVNVIVDRIVNDIGNKIILLPKDTNEANKLISQIKDFVKGTVSDSFATIEIVDGRISQEQSLAIVDDVYKTAFDIMETEGDSE